MCFISRFFKRVLGRGSRDVSGAGPGDKAFLVGINAYPSSPLRGCVNDIVDLKWMLLHEFEFKEDNVRVLLDGDATAANMLDGLHWLTSGAKAGDRRFHHFSGHGTQFPCRDEADGLAEAVCPVNFDWTPKTAILDDEYFSIFSGMEKGVILNWTSDSCHSGDLQRYILASGAPPLATPRFMKPPHEVIAKFSSRMRGLHRMARSTTGGVLDVGYASACRSDQTAADTEIGGRPCGAFSWFLRMKLVGMSRSSPLVDVIQSVRESLASAGYSQIPQVEGTRAKRPFLIS